MNWKFVIIIGIAAVSVLAGAHALGGGVEIEESNAKASVGINSSGGQMKMISEYLSQGLLYIVIAVILLIIWLLLVYKV